MYTPSFRTNRNNVPFLPKQDIEEIAESYALDFCPKILEKPQPIDIESFLEFYLGLNMDYQYLSNDGRYLGMMVFNDTNRVIIYDPEKNEADYLHADANTVIVDNRLLAGNQRHRYRYTCAHEGGHSIFHAAYYCNAIPESFPLYAPLPEDSSAIVQCSEDDMKSVTKGGKWPPKKTMEWQANYFASALLMPRMAVDAVMEKFTAGIEISNKRYAMTQAVSEVFDVSMDAATNRLKELGWYDRADPCHRSPLK